MTADAMPLSTPFVTFRPDKPPELVGCYELGWSGAIVYVGMGCIRDRLLAHRRADDRRFNQYRCRVTNCRRRAGQIERRELRRIYERRGEMPKYNEQLG